MPDAVPGRRRPAREGRVCRLARALNDDKTGFVDFSDPASCRFLEVEAPRTCGEGSGQGSTPGGTMVSKVIAATLGAVLAAALLVGGAVYITSTREASRQAKLATARAEHARAAAHRTARKAAAQKAAAERKAAAASKAAAVEKAKAQAKQDSSSTQRRPSGTRCQRMYDAGVPLYQAYDAWARAGYPPSWDADGDGIPCERSYGEAN